MLLWLELTVVWQWLVFRQDNYLHRDVADRLDVEHSVYEAEDGDRQAMDYNGEKDEPIDDWDVSCMLDEYTDENVVRH